MKISDKFEQEKISHSMVSDAADISDYWNSSSTFILRNWNQHLELMTDKQAAWAEKILEDLTEKRINGELS